MVGRTRKPLFDLVTELNVMAGSAVGYHIIGTLGEEDSDEEHVVVQLSFQMWGLLPDMMLEQCATYFGWLLFSQVYRLYETKEVPRDMVWTGHVVTGLNMN